MNARTTSRLRTTADRWAGRLLAVAFVLFIATGANRVRTAWELPGERLLMIHADDAGLCSTANRGTIAAMRRGVVTSASVMVTCPGFEEFAAYARAHPEEDVGVHLTLTSEWDDLRWGPVTDAADVPSLVASDGTFWRSADEFARHAQLADVETEIHAQIERARKSGIRVSHLDSHMNSLYRRPDLLELFVRISEEEQLPIRFAKRLPRGWKDALPPPVLDAYHAQLKVLYANHNPLADHIEADNYQAPPGEKRDYILRFLRSLEPGVSELVVHCCLPDGESWSPPDAAGRHAETVLLLSSEIEREIDILGIRLINWKTLRQLSQDTQRPHW